LVLLAGSTQLSAQDYSARNAAMGGAGVASSDYLGAPFINPALTTRYSTANDDDWGLMLPTFGIFVADPDEVLDDLDSFEESYDAIESAWAGGTAPTQAQLDVLAADLNALSGKAVQLQAFAGATLAIPSRDFAMALVIRGNVDASGFLLVDPADVTAIENATSGSALPTIGSEAVMLGAGISEVGLSIGTTLDVWDERLSIGITPKMQRVEVFNYAVTLDNAGDLEDDFDDDIFRNDDTAFNVDLGAHLQVNDELSVGLAIRNLLEQDILTPPTRGRAYTYTLSPVATLGAAWTWDFLTLATDLDLTKQDGFSTTDGMQFVRVGAEAGWTWGQLRAGFRKDLEDTVDDMFTAGIGLSPFGVFHLDLTGAVGADSYGALLAMSFTF
jgi:hypothetical protein